MKMFGETLPNKRLVEKMLISLTPAYDNIVLVIEGTKKLDEINPNEVVATLKGFKQRLKRHTEDEEVSDKAFSSLSIQNKSGSQTKMLSNPVLTRRTQERHVKYVEIYTIVNADSKGSRSVTTVADSIILLKIAKVNQFNSGCNNHMTPHESVLINLDISVSTRIKIGNGQIVQASRKGTLMIETKKGTRHIKEVMLVSGLDENLLSVGQMMQHGYFLLFGDDQVEIFEDTSLESHVVTIQITCNR
ncbi:uncharacterized protein LOC125469237 [Pyrus x bretschneideri]|uniref:uncharacterized protein LOC125469237 n=1 Tax=Pyrus x bretschneideri TaxID=225117 RepID=UPI00202F887E|nr:uncharacterized protein LOC125469237 [Pyrus x bretschneideri]